MTGQHVLSERLKQCRIEARLSQDQLAHLAGCSDQVLRKAEAGDSVRQATIQRIFEILTDYGQVTSLQELTDGTSAIARRFFDSCNQHGADLSLHFDLFADDLLVVVLVASSQLPFARRWFGLRGLGSCLDQFSQVFCRERLAAVPVILGAGNQVTIR